ncbi:hypothetical protein FQR65_LT13786 [Abscondita terminalis]|nr:hypothetical protein FQR65_LT13786 [Abscondita terminalis]
MLFELLRKRPLLTSGRFSNDFTKKSTTRMGRNYRNTKQYSRWKKNWTQWRKTWHDYRSKAKKQQAAALQHSRGTGGGPSIDIKTDESITDLINPISVAGHPNDFNFSEPSTSNATKHDGLEINEACVIADHDYCTETVQVVHEAVPETPTKCMKFKKYFVALLKFLLVCKGTPKKPNG